MQQEGLGRLFALDKLAEGPFPEHYEPMETPLGTNPLHPKVVSSPVVRLYEEDAIRLGKKDKFPYVGTTYRLTEHFHTDQACVAQFHRAAGTVCRNQRRAGEKQRYR
nr:Formate dehydrogenase, nitrate-inducible, major subunit precursor [Klebsiella pneumoniae]